jgi:hypothetical protein
MQDEMTGREFAGQGAVEPEILTGSDVETSAETNAAQLGCRRSSTMRGSVR